MKMKLWVKEDVLGDWTEGIVCVLAESEEDAWEVLKKKDRRAWEWLRLRNAQLRFRKSEYYL